MERLVINNRLYEENFNNVGSLMKIIEYNSSSDIMILFPQYNWTCKNKYSHFKDGSIKCPYEPRYYNKGYIGEGKYNIKNDKKIFIIWTDMMKRCYDKNLHLKEGTYKDCEVCKEWHNFQNFVKWYEENYYIIDKEIMALDKDILIKGNKIYSPNTCIFVPKRINNLFTKRDKDRGVYPIGVSYEKSRNKLLVQCNDGNRVKKLGRFNINQVEEAFQCYKQFKEKVIKQVADEYKDRIPQNLYDAMYRYKVEITD